MDVHVLVTAAGPQAPPAGLPVVVEIRDTSRLDVASTTVCSGQTVTGEAAEGQVVAELDLEIPKGGPDGDGPDRDALTVWVRVVATDQEHVAAGDWITVQAYPVRSHSVEVEVVPV